jgi:rod shape-determining protein MreB
VRVAGNRLDQAIVDFVRRRHGLAIGDRTAEEIKITIGSAVILNEEEVMEVKGRDMISGLPKTVTVATNEVVQAITDELLEIAKAVKTVLQDTPPELASDIIDKGMVMTGGTALLRNLDHFIAQSVGVPCFVAEEPLLCVAKGTGVALDNLDSYKKSILSAK